MLIFVGKYGCFFTNNALKFIEKNELSGYIVSFDHSRDFWNTFDNEMAKLGSQFDQKLSWDARTFPCILHKTSNGKFKLYDSNEFSKLTDIETTSDVSIANVPLTKSLKNATLFLRRKQNVYFDFRL